MTQAWAQQGWSYGEVAQRDAVFVASRAAHRQHDALRAAAGDDMAHAKAASGRVVRKDQASGRRQAHVKLRLLERRQRRARAHHRWPAGDASYCRHGAQRVGRGTSGWCGAGRRRRWQRAKRLGCARVASRASHAQSERVGGRRQLGRRGGGGRLR
eukprot:6525317-Prymnesium_polylepis.1